jgi:hypothetical protein
MDDATKTCLKATTLTDCQRLTAWCGPEKKCIMDAVMAKAGNLKPEQMSNDLKSRIVSNYCDSIEKLCFILS